MVALLTVGCSDRTRPAPPPPLPSPPPETRITIHAINRGRATAAVYALVDGVHLIVGELETGEAATLQLPSMANHAWQIRISVIAIGVAGGFTSEPLPVPLGGVIDLVVEDVISRSSATVRSPPSDAQDGGV